MYATEAFDRLPDEKKRHIIQICINLFAEYGYDQTSTDKIVQAAGISKGILFHYFGSKKNLFLYIVRYVSRLLAEVVMDGISEVGGEDFFERIKRLVIEKQLVLLQYHKESKLCADALMNPPKNMVKEMEEFMQEYYSLYSQSQYQLLYPKHLLPIDRLRPGVSTDLVVEMTRMIVEKVTDKYMLMYKGREYDILGDQGPFLEELDDYFRIIRQGAFRS